MRNNSKKRPSELLIGVLLIGIVAGAVIAIGVDGRFTNNQKVACMTLTNGICIVQIQNGVAEYQFFPGDNHVCKNVFYPLPLARGNVSFAFAQPHLGVMSFPVGEKVLVGDLGQNVTTTFLVGGTGANPLLFPNSPNYIAFMPQLNWHGNGSPSLQLSIQENDDNVTDAGLSFGPSLQIWTQWTIANLRAPGQYEPSIPPVWKNFTNPIFPGNNTLEVPPINYPVGWSSVVTPQNQPANIIPNGPLFLRLVYANIVTAASNPVVEKLVYTDLKVTIYANGVAYPNPLFTFGDHVTLCLFGSVDSFALSTQVFDLQWTAIVSCRYQGSSTTPPFPTKNYVQC